VETTEQTIDEAVESLIRPDAEPVEAVEPEVDDVDDDLENEAPLEDEETDELEAEATEDDDDGEEIQDDYDTDGDGDVEPEVLTVKVDGEEIPVTLDDLKRDYSGQKYIQKGMQEAAEAKKQAEAIYNALQQERAALAAYGNELQSTGLRKPEPPNADTFNSDPIGYMEQKIKFDAEMEQYEAKAQQFTELTAQQRQAEVQARNSYVQQQAELLKQYIPELGDAAQATKVQEGLRMAGREYDFSDEELSQITDSRAVRVLNDARKWRELQASKKTTVATAQKKARPAVKSSAAKATNTTRADLAAKRKRLSQTGSLDDAVSLIFKS
jgi:hypothetical protein